MSTINQWPYFNDVEFRALTYQPHTANDNVRGPRTPITQPITTN